MPSLYGANFNQNTILPMTFTPSSQVRFDRTDVRILSEFLGNAQRPTAEERPLLLGRMSVNTLSA